MSEAPPQADGQRRPLAEDLEPLLEMVWEGKSLRAACRNLGLHAPSTSDWLHANEVRREQYARAREGRAEHLQEDALLVTRAAALSHKVGDNKVDPAGSRAYLDAVKWSTARMAPKTAPVETHNHLHAFRKMTDEELDAEIAARSAEMAKPADADAGH